MKKAKPREIVLVDFSDAIFVARNNLRGVDNALFFMADIRRLPFRADFTDLLFSLGVLHHLPENALKFVRELRGYSQRLLIYLYSALDNRPLYFRLILRIVTVVRNLVSRVRARWFRAVFSWSVAALVYWPMIRLGKLLNPFKLAQYIPLYEAHCSKDFHWLQLMVYDRFFTCIEQRVSRDEIMTLKDSFSEVLVSSIGPYWHFICRR